MASTDTIDLSSYLAAAARAGRAIAAVTIVAGVVAGVTSWMAPRTYKATATMQVSAPKFGEGINQVLMPTPASFRPLIESPSVAAAVIADLHLDQPPESLTASTFASRVTIEEV